MTTLKLSATTNLVKTTTMTTMTKDVDDDGNDDDDDYGVDNDLNSFGRTSRRTARVATAANFEALNNF